MTTAAENKSTPQVDRSMILLGFQMEVPKYTVNPQTKKRERAGTYKTLKDQVPIYWSKRIFSYFDIQELSIDLSSLAQEGDVPWSKGSDAVAKYYEELTSSGTKDVARKGATRRTGRIKGASSRSGLSVQVPLLDSRTSKGKFRHVSLLFPRFFNLTMITQALSQIFASTKSDRKPPYFMTKAGARYSIPYSSALNVKAVIAPADCGAWTLSAPMETSNNNQDDPIPDDPEVVSNAANGGKTKA